MIVLDTNVLSALMQRTPDRGTAAWADQQPRTSLWTTSVTAYEIRSGIELLPAGRRRTDLELAFDKLVNGLLDHRVLPFDFAAADAAGTIAGIQAKAGRPVEIRDVQIAGIAVACKASLATRNVRHFQGIGLTIIDPWAA